MDAININQGTEIFFVKIASTDNSNVEPVTTEKVYWRMIKDGVNNPTDISDFSQVIGTDPSITKTFAITKIIKGTTEGQLAVHPTDGDGIYDNYGSIYVPVSDFDEPTN